MNYYDDLTFLAFDHVPRCSVWIDRDFPEYFALNFACAGEIQWAMNGSSPVTLAAPAVWWTWPGPHFHYGCAQGASWNHYYVTFRGPRAERFFREGLLPGCPVPFTHLNTQDAEIFLQDWERLFTLLLRGEAQAYSAAVHRLEGLLLRLHPLEDARADRPHQAVIDALAEAIRRDYKRQWDWREEASKQNISEAHLRRLFRNQLHAPPHQYLMRARMEAAGRMLRSTAVPITQIAEAVGVPDIYHFSKLFKAHHQLSPRAYRHKMRLFYDPSTAFSNEQSAGY
jgi:AraC family transcriptional regulator, arabinose operon regulatory protein